MKPSAKNNGLLTNSSTANNTLYLPKSGVEICVQFHRFRNSAMLGVTVEVGVVTIENQSFIISLKKKMNTALT